ncbi:MAG: outer membrane protein assembly factor BamE [Legionellaceae bacterium]|nr:outer membrane protein assembly factor BamE [Legionellaceae bacterium]
MQIRIILIILSISLSMAGCTTYDYSRTTVQQGNLLSQSRIDRLQIGMSKEDVAILMGTSLISPLFNTDRWDYAYTWQRVGKFEKIKTVSLKFVNQRLASIEQYPARKSAGQSSDKKSKS